jgi:long-subunit acyl-CoA synthetase (AMP-forming)
MGLIERIAAHAGSRGDDAALAHGHDQVGFHALHGMLTEAAATLQARGLRSLALDLDNGPAFAVCDLAGRAAGLTVLPLPPFFSPGQLRHAFASSGVEAVATDNVERLRQRLPGLAVREDSGWVVAGQRLRLLTLAADRTDLPPDTSKITFTSGSTGEPHGVLLGGTQLDAVTAALADAAEVRPGDRCIALAPLSVLLENVGSLYVPLWCGATAVLSPLAETGLGGGAGLDAVRMHRALSGSRATGAIFSPQTLLGLVRVLERGAPGLEQLRFAAVGGAPVSETLLERARRLGLPVYEGYGLSECGSVVTLNTPGANRPGSAGRPLPQVRVRIAADGEVEISGNLFSGYLGDPPARMEDRWWRSGDLGRLDQDGYLFIAGRRRNMLITSFGRNVSPDWVEGELTQEPAVAQAAVFGEARPYLTAVLVPAPGADGAALTAAVANANRRLPDYARVLRWLRADEPFTTANGLFTGTGRIRRAAVSARYEARIATLYEEREAS